MTHCPPTTMAITPANKKGRRFSLIRIFNNNNTNNSSSGSNSLTLGPISEAQYRHSMEPTAVNSMRLEMMRERRKSVAAMTENSLRSVSRDLRPLSLRPILSRKETQPQMTEKMRQFDELLQTRCSSTIRISLTPSLLQEP
ncbi:hypothetical protein BGZ54_006905 [Gamsiella multidivaricata]|nr:hypothetical protein BGZ54_006905 [Gamsiella multidivaricata]